jgi:hypothetical protein
MLLASDQLTETDLATECHYIVTFCCMARIYFLTFKICMYGECKIEMLWVLG